MRRYQMESPYLLSCTSSIPDCLTWWVFSSSCTGSLLLWQLTVSVFWIIHKERLKMSNSSARKYVVTHKRLLQANTWLPRMNLQWCVSCMSCPGHGMGALVSFPGTCSNGIPKTCLVGWVVALGDEAGGDRLETGDKGQGTATPVPHPTPAFHTLRSLN